MAKVIFNKPVKYNGTKYDANVAITIKDVDKEHMLANGGHEIVESDPQNPAQPGLGNVIKKDGEPVKKAYKDMGAPELIAELDARGINDATLTNKEKRVARLIEHDAELAKGEGATELEAKKVEAEDLEIEVLPEDTAETLQVKIDTKLAELDGQDDANAEAGQSGEGRGE